MAASTGTNRTDTMNCDFCNAPGPAWEYPCKDFEMDLHLKSVGPWMACDPCHDLIETKQAEKLVIRAMDHHSLLINNIGHDAAFQLIDRLHSSFRLNRTGPPTRN